MFVKPRAWPTMFARLLQAKLPRRKIDFRLLTESSADVIWLLSPMRTVEYVSRAALQVFGCPPGEMIGRSLENFVAPKDWPEIVASMHRLKSGTGFSARAVFQARRSDQA